jgi:transposase InsO family protein
MPTKDELAAELQAARQRIQDLEATATQAGASGGTAQPEPPGWLSAILQQQTDFQAMQAEAFKDLIKAVAPDRDASTSQKTNMPKPSPPTKLERGVSHAMFKVWRESWDDFARLSDVAKEPREKQVAILKGCMGLKMRMDLQHAIGVADTDTPTAILDKIDQYLRSKRSLAVDHVEFFQRKQRAGEQFDVFLVDLRNLAEAACLTDRHCQACRKPCLERHLAAKIASGLANEETRRKLLAQRPFPPLDDVIAFCRVEESSVKDTKQVMAGDSKSINAVGKSEGNKGNNKYKKGKFKKGGSQGKPDDPGAKKPSEGKPQERFCKFCGKDIKKCNKSCMKKEDVQREVKKMSRVHQINLISSQAHRHVEVFMRQGKRDLGKFFVMPDTGADVSVAGPEFLERCGIPVDQLQATTDVLRAANGTDLKCHGLVPIQLSLGKKSHVTKVYITPTVEGTDFLLSFDDCKGIGLLAKEWPQQVSKAEDVKRVQEIQKVDFTISEEPTDQEWSTLKGKLLDAYADVFTTSELKPMKGGPMTIHLREDAVPRAVPVPHRLPVACRDDVQEQLDKQERQGVIARVDYPTDWVHPMVVVPKPKGGWRLCVDLRELNKHIKRPYHPLTTPREAIQVVPKTSKYFSTLDATTGYWQIPLDQASQDLTTFITPKGRYKYLRNPMGLSSAQDEYGRRGDLAMEGLVGVSKVVDDILVFSDTAQEHLRRVVRVLDRCREHGITLHPKKFFFGQDDVEYVGYRVNRQGYRADPGKVAAIRDFPTPSNIHELRSFFGLVNQLAEFTTDIARAAEPLRPLLRPHNVYLWSDVQQHAFEQVKAALVKPPILATFDPALPTRLETDASRLKGLGFVLRQLHPDGRWRLVQCGSRFITDTESRYAIIELEMLGVVWAVKKLRVFLQGLPEFEIKVDHRPLVPILNSYTLDQVENLRLQRLKEKLQMYNFTASWQSGKDHALADALSRAPLNDPVPEDCLAEAREDDEALQLGVRAIVRAQLAPLADPHLTEIKMHSEDDEEYCAVIQAVINGFPSPSDKVSSLIQPYWRERDNLSVVDGLLLRNGKQLVIPRSMRRQVLEALHSSHLGINMTKRRARDSVFWPGISSDVKNMVEACYECQIRLPSQQQETYSTDVCTTRPFEDVSADLFTTEGHHYLVYVDRYSGWPLVYSWKRDPDTSQVVRAIAGFFTFGVPVRIRTDNGPQFKSVEFADFLKEWHIRHDPSSPHYPQSNGHAEAGVSSMKSLITKLHARGDVRSEAFMRAYIEYLNTPKEHGRSPAQLVFGRPTRTGLPMHPNAFGPGPDHEEAAAFVLEKHQARYDSRAKDLPPLAVGQPVLVQNASTKLWDRRGIVETVGEHRDYDVRLEGGGIKRRNRRFLRPDKAAMQVKPPAAQVPSRSVSPASEAEPAQRASKRRRKKPDRYQAGQA